MCSSGSRALTLTSSRISGATPSVQRWTIEASATSTPSTTATISRLVNVLPVKLRSPRSKINVSEAAIVSPRGYFYVRAYCNQFTNMSASWHAQMRAGSLPHKATKQWEIPISKTPSINRMANSISKSEKLSIGILHKKMAPSSQRMRRLSQKQRFTG